MSGTDETWNPVAGCTRVSRGCDNCYAVGHTHRLGVMAESDRGTGRTTGRLAKYVGLTVENKKGERHFNGTVRCDEAALAVPLGWKKPRRVFVSSMSDLFHPGVPLEFIDRVFAVMALCPKHTFQILTKRPERMAEYFNGTGRSVQDRRIDIAEASHEIGSWKGSHKGWCPVHGRSGFYLPPWPLPNVWLGTSAEDQAAWDERVPHLHRCPAAVTFVSMEPLLGPVDIQSAYWHMDRDGGDWRAEDDRIGWIIVGGESGPKARPCRVEWVRSVVAQAKAAGVPVFVKQLGARPCSSFDEWNNGDRTEGKLREDGEVVDWTLQDRKGGDPGEWPEDLRVREMPHTAKNRSTA